MMIELHSNSRINENRLASNLYNLGWSNFEIDIDTVQSDMNKLEAIGSMVKPRSNEAKSLVAVARHIASIEKAVSNGRLNYRHTYGNEAIETVPYKMVKVPEFKIQTSDYIVLNGEVAVTLDFTNVMDYIAFAMCYRDLWTSWGELEEALCKDGANLIGAQRLHNMPHLIELADGVTYEKCKNMAYERSDFQSGSENGGYFGDKIDSKKAGKTYYWHLEKAAKKAACIICDAVLDKLATGEQFAWKLVAVYQTEIIFITAPCNVDKLKEVLAESMEIEIHSKKIIIDPEVR